MRQTNLGAFFGGGKPEDSKKPDASLREKDGKDHSELKKSMPTVEDIDEEFEVSKPTKKAHEAIVTLFHPLSVPQKVNLIEADQKKKLRPIDSENYRPDLDCIFSPKWIELAKDEKGKNLQNFAPFCVVADVFDILAEIKGKDSKSRKKQVISNMF
jgi:hypothetical protein